MNHRRQELFDLSVNQIGETVSLSFGQISVVVEYRGVETKCNMPDSTQFCRENN